MKEVDVQRVVSEAERIIRHKDRREFRPVKLSVKSTNVIALSVYLHSMIRRKRIEYAKGLSCEDDVWRGEDMGSVLLRRFIGDAKKSVRTVELFVSGYEMNYLIHNVKLGSEKVRLALRDFEHAFVNGETQKPKGAAG